MRIGIIGMYVRLWDLNDSIVTSLQDIYIFIAYMTDKEINNHIM